MTPPKGTTGLAQQAPVEPTRWIESKDANRAGCRTRSDMSFTIPASKQWQSNIS